MTINSIKLKNFQAHRDLQLNFVPGVNAIVGPTNIGKSSVFRAVRWLVEHNPISGLQTFDTDDTRVGIKSDTGVVTRFKNNKGYGYRIGGQDFVACGTNQPSEVQQVLGLAEINLQGQHDPPFLLTLTPGQMAKELNRIVDLSVIDKTMTIASSAVAAAKSQATAMEDLAKQHEDALAKLDWVVGADAELRGIEAAESAIQESEAKIKSLETLLLAMLSNHSQQQELVPLIEGLSALSKDISEFEETKTKCRKLSFAIGAADDNAVVLKQVNAAGKALSGLSATAKAVAESKAKVEALQRLVALQEQISTLNDIGPELDLMLADAASIKSANDTIKRLKELLALHKMAVDSTAIHDKEITRLEKEKPVCPACKRPLK